MKVLTFLGSTSENTKVNALPNQKKGSVKSIYSSIRECVNKNKSASQRELILRIKPKITGWTNFYRHAASKRTFALMDNKLFRLLWKWAKRRHPNKNLHWIKAKYFKIAGKRHWVFMASDKKRQIELPRFDATKIIRHVKIMAKANPYDHDWQGYFEERRKRQFVNSRNISKFSHAN